MVTTSHAVRESGPLVSLSFGGSIRRRAGSQSTDGCGYFCEDALWALLMLPAFFCLSSQTFGCMEYVIHMVVVVWGGIEFEPLFFISLLWQ